MINELYPLAALFIHANNQEITKERIASVLSALGVESQMKICEFFEMDAIKMRDMLASSSQAAAPAAAAAPAGPAKTEEKKEEAAEEELEIDFGFF